jgi:hypothetical protein
MRRIFSSTFFPISITVKLVRLIRMCLNETISKVHLDKYLSANFHVQNGSKQGDALSPQL